MDPTFDRLAHALAGRYELERKLGQGGMATVYLARDLKHEREVAVKVLRPELAATLGADRFLREVRIAASLTHPHILGLHDSGEADGFLYYVMPYVPGESLRERLAREGELPIPSAVRILREVADALAYAHAQGVVHRDVKPDNVLLTARHAVVTDFGVAKAVTEAAGGTTITTAGVAIGTPAYMAPEQAVAEPHIDHRADLYAFGAMAYEMLAGQPPFVGDTQHELLAAHVTQQPIALRERRDTIPAPLEELVMACLAKRAADRPQSADELLPRLEALATPGAGTTPAAATRAVAVRRFRGTRTAVLAGTIVALAVLGVLGWDSLRRSTPAVTVSNVRQVTRAPEVELDPAISPDGREVAYVRAVAGGFGIFIQDLRGGRAIPLSGEVHPRATVPRWTTDGRSIVFTGLDVFAGLEIAEQEAFVVPRLGGAPRSLGRMRVWDVREGEILYTQGDTLYIRGLEGGPARAIAAGDVHSARWSPDGRRIAWVRENGMYVNIPHLGNVAPSEIWVARSDGTEAVAIAGGGALNASPAWLGSEHVLFVSSRDGSRDLYLQRLDGDGRPRGEVVRVTTGLDPHTVSVDVEGRFAAYSRFLLRRNVYTVALPGPGEPAVSVATAVPVTVGNQVVENHGVSPDGEWLAYDSNLEGNQDIYIMPIGGGEPRRLTSDPADDFHPDFSPSGQEIAFYSTRHGTRDIFLMQVDGSGTTRVTSLPGEEHHPSFSPDGRHIAFTYREAGQGQLVVVISRQDPGAAWGEPRFLGPARRRGPIMRSRLARWSPDGRHLAYGSPEGIVVQTLDGEPRLVRTGAEWDPFQWSPDGRVVYAEDLSRAQGGIWAIPVDGGTPRLLVRFDVPSRPASYIPTVANGRLYMTLSEYESDIWMMELSRP